MATLVSALRRSLELTPLNYEFEREVDDDFSANFLVVRVKVDDGKLEWSGEDAAFTTWELRNLTWWCRDLAADSAHVPRKFWVDEPCLILEADGGGGSTRIRAYFNMGFRPPMRQSNLVGFSCWRVFRPGREDLLRFAGELEAEMRPFPIRIVEQNGEASAELRRTNPWWTN